MMQASPSQGPPPVTLDEDTAHRFARITLGHIDRPYPYLPSQVLFGDDDLTVPRNRHPIFYGSFDWHSCVHSWWQLLRIARRFPDMPLSASIRHHADRAFVTEKVGIEREHFIGADGTAFERPYGWAWTLALHEEATHHDAPWGAALEPLASAIAARFHDHLPQLTYPIRAGTHANTAFALLLALAWASRHDDRLAVLIRSRAMSYFSGDRACQAWEPGGDDFLSPALIEALLMLHVLPPQSATRWFDDFLPRLADGEPASLFQPVAPSNRADGKLAHLDGVNLSRAWCSRRIATLLGDTHPAASGLRRSAIRHLDASLPHLDNDYMGSHWLPSFALLALDGKDG